MIYLFINFIFWFSTKQKVHVPKGLFFIYGGGGLGGLVAFLWLPLKKLWPNPEISFYFMAHPLLFV